MALVESFTSKRLRVLHAMCRDPRVSDGHFRIAFRVSQQIDEETGVAIISDETLCDELPKTEPKKLRQFRTAMESAGWIKLTRGRRYRATVYCLLSDNVEPVTEIMTAKKAARDDRRNREVRKRLDHHQPGNFPCLRSRGEEIVRGANLPAYGPSQAGNQHPLSQGKSPPLHTDSHTEDRFPPTVQDVATEPQPVDPFDRSEWDAEDWQALYEERAGILEFDGGYSRAQAEDMAAVETAGMRGGI